jgi:GR25 family glycosyltransferase involved in LPS biosynthesis
MKIIVISLIRSLSRREYVSQHFLNLGVEFEFLDATTPSDLPLNKQNSAIAIWDSHVRAMKQFLNSSDDCCLIFEDDVDLESGIKSKIRILNNLDAIMRCVPKDYSIIQFGNMGFNERNFGAKFLRNFYFFFLGRHRFDEKPFKDLRDGLGNVRYRKLQKDLRKLTGVRAKPLEGFATGAQAYLINRAAAEFLISDYSNRTNWDIRSRYCLDTYLEISSNSPDTPTQIRTIRLARSVFQQRPVASMNNFFPS